MAYDQIIFDKSARVFADADFESELGEFTGRLATLTLHN